MESKLIGPFKQLISLADCPIKGPVKDDNLHIINDGGLLVKGDSIVKTGRFEQLVSEADKIHEINTDQVCIPGIIDSHTHICFAGSRARDYEARNNGKTYLEIAKEGGGIWDTVVKTRNANESQLVEGIKERAKRHLSEGVTTIEVKSGYGLSVEEEIKMLTSVKQANREISVDLITTCLAAHVLPRDFDGDHKEYLAHLSESLFPVLKEKQLTNRIDAFVEEEAFDYSCVKEYFQKAKNLGFELTVHADQFSPGGSQLAVDMNALSADHLESSTNHEIQLLAKSEVVATALPGASMGLGMAFTPARKLLDQGASVAIASDWNPGSAPMGDLLMQACVLGSYEKLSNIEVLSGITIRAAKALGLTDRGCLEPGKLADFITFQTGDFREIFYHQGKMKPTSVFKEGNQIHKN